MLDSEVGELCGREVRHPYLGYFFYDDITEKYKPLLWVIQRLVDLDRPLTIMEISKVSGKDPFYVKKAIDEFEASGLRLRKYDEKTGEYILLRH